MITSLNKEDSSAAALAVSSSTVGQNAGLLTLAGDALCLAMTALRLSDASPKVQQPSKTNSSPRIIPLEEVSCHDHVTDCWIVVYDHVYDVTNFLMEHPGGEGILLEYAGRDATLAFNGIGHGPAMLKALEQYTVGILPESERIFSNQEGRLGFIKLTSILS